LQSQKSNILIKISKIQRKDYKDRNAQLQQLYTAYTNPKVVIPLVYGKNLLGQL